jgi:hypothetical protein
MLIETANTKDRSIFYPLKIFCKGLSILEEKLENTDPFDEA